MLNEPFRILDNIPLIWCFASFETYQSRLVEIVTQKRGLADTLRSAQLIHFHASYSHNTQSATRAKIVPCVRGGGETKREMKNESGVRVIACSGDTWSLSGEEILG